MRLRLALGMVGGLIGADLGLLFGALPAGALAFAALENLLPSSGPGSEAVIFVALWGGFVLLTAAIGVVTGLLIDRLRQGPPDSDRFGPRPGTAEWPVGAARDREPALPR